MKKKVNPKLWYRIDYDGMCHAEYEFKSMCFDEGEKIDSRIMKGAYQTKELTYIIKGDVLLKHYSEFTDNDFIEVGL